MHLFLIVFFFFDCYRFSYDNCYNLPAWQCATVSSNTVHNSVTHQLSKSNSCQIQNHSLIQTAVKFKTTVRFKTAVWFKIDVKIQKTLKKKKEEEISSFLPLCLWVVVRCVSRNWLPQSVHYVSRNWLPRSVHYKLQYLPISTTAVSFSVTRSQSHQTATTWLLFLRTGTWATAFLLCYMVCRIE